jgi:preprotein translocase SecA subunit
MFTFIKNLVGDGTERAVKQIDPIVKRINSLAATFEALSSEQLAAKTDDFRRRFQEQTTDKLRQLEDVYNEQNLRDPVVEKEYQQRRRVVEDAALDVILPEAFAAVREASRRTIGMYHYDVQLTGGIVLHQGKIAEMKTGEGKTLVATLPMYLNALAGHGVHLITVNDYLARRDAGWMGPIYHLLGLSVGFIAHDYSALFDPEYVDPTVSLDDERLVHWRPCSRREAYAADITYGTNNEFGFDYLRDNGVQSFEQMVQRGHHYAIVDEVDNILIDEARTPLIISGPARESSTQYARFAALVDKLKAGKVTPDEVKNGATPDGDVLLDPKTRSVVLTDTGLAKIEGQLEELGVGESVYDPQHSDLTHYLENALKAKFIFHRDKDYIVTQEHEVIIVDEFTGRLMPGRRWSDGLHQSVEAKEGVAVRREQVTYATITFQNYFRMYSKLAGMTGTAATEREEFGKIYNLDVIVIPPNKKIARTDLTDQIFRSEDAKFQAVATEIQECIDRSQPVLVGTTSVKTSEKLSRLLKEKGIKHQVLNAKQHQAEARVVAQAARPGVVTIATNMAGRGTDILLGGNVEALAAQYLDEQGLSRSQVVELAQNLFGDQKTKVSRQKLIERSNGKLDDAMIDELTAGLNQIADEYERIVEIIDVQDKGRPQQYLIDRTLSDVPADYYRQKFELVRAVLDEDLPRARALVAEVDALKEEQIVEIRRLFKDYRAYRRNRARDRRPTFLANKLFDQIYTTRARLVQLMLRGEEAKARQLARDTLGLNEAYVDGLQAILRECAEDRQRVKQAGGLHIIGTERHEARRIDNQLRGRAGRQGDAGSSRFYLSLEDELMHRFGRMDTINNVMGRLGLEDNMPIEARVINRSIESAQTRVEGYNFDARKHTVEYDDVMNKQRETIYARRRRIMQEAEEQQRIDELLNRYLDADAYRTWARDEIRAAVALVDEQVLVGLDDLLPDADTLTILRAAKDSALVDSLIAQQVAQNRPLELLIRELNEFLELPADAEQQLRGADRPTAQRYIAELRRAQPAASAADDRRIEGLLTRYLDDYARQLREAVRQVAAMVREDAQGSLTRLMPDVDLIEALEIAADDRRLDMAITQQIERQQPVMLLSQDLRDFMDVSAEDEQQLRDILHLPNDLPQHVRALLDAPADVRQSLEQHVDLPSDLEQQIRESLDSPGEVERLMQRDRRAKAEDYVNELWRAQNPGNVEDRIKEAFENELSSLVSRYMDGYEDWMHEQIREVIEDATNPATDDLNLPLVQRRLSTLLPALAQDDPVELGTLSSDQLQRRIEGYIARNRESGYNIDLLVREVSSRIGVVTGAPDMQHWLTVNSAMREQLRVRYLTMYGTRIDELTLRLTEAEQDRVREEAIEYVSQQLHPLFVSSARLTLRDLQQIHLAILQNGLEIFRAVLNQLDAEALEDTLKELLNCEFDRARREIGVRQMGIYQRSLMLQTIDLEWQQYLTAMDDLRQGIGLQAIGQRDPLIQYQTEGYRMFSELLDNIDQTMVQSFFHRLHDHKRIVQQYEEEAARREQASRLGFEIISGGTTNSATGRTLRRELPKVGRNDLCPCGSGKKYKYCHGSSAEALPARGREKDSPADGAANGAEKPNGASAAAVGEARPAAKGRTPPPANGQGGRGRNAPPTPQRGKQSSQKSKHK